jgi:hypothetical protein
MLLKVGQRFLAALTPSLPFEQKNGQRAEERKIARRRSFLHRTAVFVLGAVPAVVLTVFDTPVVAPDLEQFFGTRLLGPVSGHGKTGIVGLFDDPASAHLLSVAVDAHHLSHPG